MSDDVFTSSGPIMPARIRLTKMPKAARGKRSIRSINKWMRDNYDSIVRLAEANCLRLTGRKSL